MNRFDIDPDSIGFIPGLNWKSPRRISKSILKAHNRCQRWLWHDKLAQDQQIWTDQGMIELGQKGTDLHLIDELFLKDVAKSKTFKKYIIEDPEATILSFFEAYEHNGPMVYNLAKWHISRFKFYSSRYEIDKAWHYFCPVILDGEPMVEMKLYSKQLDRSMKMDGVFWIPGTPTKKQGITEVPDEILIHDLKSTLNKPSQHTWLRKELNFMRSILNDLDPFPGHKCTTGAITFIKEESIDNMKFICRFTKRQDTSLTNSVNKLQHSIDHDYWPCVKTNPNSSYTPCSWCPFSYICDIDEREIDKEETKDGRCICGKKENWFEK